MSQASADRISPPGSPSRWVQRRPLLTAAAVAALLIAAGVSGVMWLVGRHQTAQQALAAQLVQQALDQANTLRTRARALPPGDADQREREAGVWRDALAAGERVAQALAGDAVPGETREAAQAMLDELRAQAADAEKDRRMLRQLDRARDLLIDVQESDVARPHSRQVVVGHAAVQAYASAFRDYGIDVASLTAGEAAQRMRARRIGPQLAAALDGWYFAEATTSGGRLLEIAGTADGDALAGRVRGAILRGDAAALRELADNAQSIDLPPSTLMLLVEALHSAGMPAPGLGLVQRACRKQPGNFWVQHSAGIYLSAGPRSGWAEAGRVLAAAVALQPANPVPWRNLGMLLTRDGQLDAAIVALQKCVELNPDAAMSHSVLADALRKKGQGSQALAVVEKALLRQPGSPSLHKVRGNVLHGMNRKAEAVAAHEQALAGEPRWYPAQLALAELHAEKGEADRAMALLEHVQRERSKDATVQLMRWQVLLKLRRSDGAVEAANAKDMVQLHLARALVRTGDFAEAQKAFADGMQQLDAASPARPIAAAELKNCERLVALDKQLEEFRFRGVLPKSAKEIFALADVARRYKQHHYTAAALYARVFTTEANLLDELIGDHRYRAACSAVLAAMGKGLDLPKATAAQKGHLRDQAQRWLHAELDECTKSVRAGKSEDTPRLIERIARWKTDADLEAVRVQALDALPASEQVAWRELWDDAELFVKAIRAGLLQITLNGALSPAMPANVHEVRLVGGRVYVFDLESTALDPALKLQDAAGKLLAENDDTGRDSRNARLVFTPPADGVYRLVATSCRAPSTGPYSLRIAAMKDGK